MPESIEAVADRLGLEKARERHKRRCPACGSSDGLHLFEGRDAFCFACSKPFDAIGLVRAALGSSYVEACAWLGVEATAPTQATRPAPEVKAYPPLLEVSTLWQACTPIERDESGRAWLTSRGLDPARAWSDDVRLLPGEPSKLPAWAQGWVAAGHRAIIPLVDAHGAMRSLKARRIGVGDGPKSRSPVGFAVKGLVFADRGARALLSGEGAWRPRCLIVCEGEVDHLATVAALDGLPAMAIETGACPGVVALPGSGSWSSAIGAAIPSDVEVAILCDADKAGEGYAAQVARDLRHCAAVLAWPVGWPRHDVAAFLAMASTRVVPPLEALGMLVSRCSEVLP